MNLLMISGDRSLLQGKKSAFWYTLQGMRRHWSRIDIICPCPTAAKSTVTDELAKDRKRMSLEYGSVYFHPNPSSKLLSQPSWILKKGVELHRRFGFGAMTVHEYPPFYNGIGARKLHKATGIPYILEIHHIIGYPKPADYIERIAYVLSRLYLKHDCKHAAAVRTVNGTVRTMLANWGVPREKIHIVSSFYLDTKLLKEAPMPPIAYDVAFCARLVANKGLGELLQAAKLSPDLRVIVIGDGPDRQMHERFVKANGLEGRITFTGWLPNREGVVQAMKSARMFVMNSTSEGGPRVLLEAMGCGIPVVTTPVGIAPDVVQDGVNGVFTDGSPQDLATKIEYVLHNHDLRKRMGRNAKEVLNLYDGDDLIDRYCSFIKSYK